MSHSRAFYAYLDGLKREMRDTRASGFRGEGRFAFTHSSPTYKREAERPSSTTLDWPEELCGGRWQRRRQKRSRTPRAPTLKQRMRLHGVKLEKDLGLRSELGLKAMV